MRDVREARRAGRRGLSLLALAVLVSLTFLASGARAAGQTVVSLTFDDGTSDQYVARSLLAARGMRGTFYVNSNTVGTSGAMTWVQLRDLSAAGNEIAGHTLDHVDLTTVSSTEARRQVCDDRTNLVAQGFSPIDFAYPYGARNSTVIQIVKDCGYRSARRSWGLRSPGSPTTYPFAETIPPQDAYQVRTPDSVKADTTLATLQGYVTQAESNGGGWVPIVLHHICSGCSTYSISEATLTAFLDWLQPRSATGTVVKTVRDVISPPPAGDTTPPTSSIACNQASCSTGWYATPVSISLSATDTGGVAAIRYTTDGSDPTAASPTYTAPFTVSQDRTIKFRAWDVAGNVEATKSQLIRFDTDGPVVAVTSPANGASVKGQVTVTANATDAKSGIAAIRFYADGSLVGTDNTAPYGVRWNARKVSRGSHTLTAVAQDVAGNTTTSAPVTVTVN